MDRRTFTILQPPLCIYNHVTRIYNSLNGRKHPLLTFIVPCFQDGLLRTEGSDGVVLVNNSKSRGTRAHERFRNSKRRSKPCIDFLD